MKAIKKIAAVAVIMAVVSAASFAVDYSGDVQLQIGWQGATLLANPDNLLRNADNFWSDAFYLGVQNWNLFNINDVFSIGFFEKVDFGFGGGTYGFAQIGGGWFVSAYRVDVDFTRFAFNVLVGPAIGIRAGNIAKFQIGAGFVAGAENMSYHYKVSGTSSGSGDGDINNAVAGFGLDLQAKFIPHFIVSPLAGFQYAFRAGGDADSVHSYALYVGGSFNFGRR